MASLVTIKDRDATRVQGNSWILLHRFKHMREGRSSCWILEHQEPHQGLIGSGLESSSDGATKAQPITATTKAMAAIRNVPIML